MKFVFQGVVVSVDGNNSCCVYHSCHVFFFNLWLVENSVMLSREKEWLFLFPGHISIEKDARYL